MSVVIPMYNTEKYIERCIASCYNQDLDQSLYEVIVVNDGSKDRCGEIVQMLADRHDTLIYIEQENQGQGIARNHGVEMARGEYIWFLDADDEMEANCLGHMVKVATNHQLDVMFFNEVLRFEDGRPDVSGEYKHMPVDTLLTGLRCYELGFQAYAMSGCFTRRQFLKDHRLQFTGKRTGEDAELCYQVVAYAERVMFILDAPYIYHVNGASVTQANKDSLPVIRRNLLNTISVGQTLEDFARKVKAERPAVVPYIEYWAMQTIFGALFTIWRRRKEFKAEGLLQPMVLELRAKKVLPYRVPIKEYKKFIITHLFINRL